MAEYIEKQAVLDEIDEDIEEFVECDYALKDTKRYIKKIPSADVRPVRRGRWEPRDLTFGRSIYECSNCKLGLFVPEMNGNPGYPYCPNCGADMREDET